jgi:GT2 family glycosyltransferase
MRRSHRAELEPARDRVEAAAWLAPGVLVALLAGPDASDLGDDARTLELDGDRCLATAAADPSALPASVREVASTAEPLAVERLAGLDDALRDRALAFLLAAPEAHGVPDEVAWPGVLPVREALRRRLPVAPVRPEERQALRVDHIWRIDDQAFWIEGWIRDADFDMTQLTAVSPEGMRVPLRERMWPHRRHDVDKAFGDQPGDEASPNRGFLALCVLDRPSRRDAGWRVEMWSASGGGTEATARAVRDAPEALRTSLMKLLRSATTDDRLARALHPALARLHRRLGNDAEAQRLVDFGDVPDRADVSVVVLLERRVDLVQHQLAHFANDPAMRSAEIVYVVDSEAEKALLDVAQGLHDVYKIPFRVLTVSPSGAIAGALNAAAAVAGGRLLLFLGRAVFPVRPGWLAPLVNRHDALERPGAVGAKLLHIDGSIQHAGLAIRPRVGPDGEPSWVAVSEFTGLSGRLPRANEARAVTAVSGACLLVAADRFLEQEGLSGEYLDGSWEDVDLCLRLSGAGYENWFVPEAELYHLDRWGPRAPSAAAVRFNAWAFDRLWGERMRTERGEPPRGRPVRELGRYPRRGVQRTGAPVEILENVAADPEESDAPIEGVVERPRPGEELQPYDKTYSLVVEGWARAAGDTPPVIELMAEGRLLRRAELNIAREDLADTTNGDAPGPAGFRAVIGVLALPQQFEVDVLARTGEHSRRLATVRGRRQRLVSAFQPTLEPALITTLGRTGSSWVALLLYCHPEIVAAKPFVFEARTTSYWMTALQALAEPSSWMQLIRPELYDGHWWLGDRIPIPLPGRLRDPRIAQWLGRDGVEMLAGFVQSRVEDFYLEIAREEEKPRARFFAEKAWPDYSSPRIVSELYPGGREIILMRDPRDIVCSVLGFNAKRGIASFGAESTVGEEELIRRRREGAVRMLESWRERSGSAHLLRYEDLILEPESTLADVFAYLGVAADAATVRRVIRDAQNTLPDAQSGHRTSTSAEASIGRWKHDLSPRQQEVCQEVFGDVLEAFGYSDQTAVTDGVIPSAVMDAHAS